MKHILLSIRKPYSDLILEGKKIFELRKTAPRLVRGDSVTLWLYESGKDGMRQIIGKCRMVSCVRLSNQMGNIVEAGFAVDACVSVLDLRNYIPCYSWLVGAPERISHMPLATIAMKRPPQSWQYLTGEQSTILEEQLVQERKVGV